jgi:hypothetical protein
MLSPARRLAQEIPTSPISPIGPVALGVGDREPVGLALLARLAVDIVAGFSVLAYRSRRPPRQLGADRVRATSFTTFLRVTALDRSLTQSMLLNRSHTVRRGSGLGSLWGYAQSRMHTRTVGGEGVMARVMRLGKHRHAGALGVRVRRQCALPVGVRAIRRSQREYHDR